MSTQRLRVAAAAAAGAAATYALARFLRWYDSDDAWLALADRIRASLPPPSQSSFRVVAVVTLVGGATSWARTSRRTRCATASARSAPPSGRSSSSPRSLAPTEVACVYIVCDASRPITPGLLCREFMYSSPFCEPATRVVTASPGLRVRIETSLAELLPRASPYARLNAREQKEWALSRTLEVPTGGPARRAYDAALGAAKGDGRDDLHPVRYGAAVVFCDGSVATARQFKALEYGCTLDPVGQLATAVADRDAAPGARAPSDLAPAPPEFEAADFVAK
ncbi:hypothetical protein JL720_11723 [Aureococcus anophagefferens]|nr:hypothetical protein JL720_11723 [Aureococcus anophagefferens]